MTKDIVFMYGVIVFERVRSGMLRKPLLNFLVAPILFVSLFILAPKVIAQTNQIHCYSGSFGCAIDLSVSPNPDCASGHRVPTNTAICPDPDSPNTCCLVQASGCNNVTCEQIEVPLTPCDNPLDECVNVSGINACNSAGGTFGLCPMGGSATGNCCRPPEDDDEPTLCSPSDWICVSMDSFPCESLVSGTYMGIGGCLTSTGGTGSCCRPPSGYTPPTGACSSNEHCEDIALGTCERELGDWGTCEDASGNPGTCCVEDRNIPPGTCPGVATCMNMSGGCFSCDWSVALGCVASLSIDRGYTCQAQYEAPDSFCSGITDPGDCWGCRNISCILGGSDDPDLQIIGYFFDATSICHPCLEYQRGSGDFNCDPPEYSTLELCCAEHLSSCGFNPTGPYDPYADQNLPNRWEELLERYSVSTSEIAATIYDILYPIGLAIGLFSIIAAGYAFMTSQGQPDKVKDAQEKLTAAVVGILFIVLSIVILRVIIRTLLDPTVPF